MAPAKPHSGLTRRILIGLLLGAIVGVLINLISPPVRSAEERIEEIILLNEDITLRIEADALLHPEVDLGNGVRAELEVPGATVRGVRVVDRTPDRRFEWIHTFLTDGLFHIVGQLFLAGLMVIVVPLVFVSLVCGTAALDDIRRLGRVGVKTVGFYLFTTAVAISLALGAALLVQPGSGLQRTADGDFEVAVPPSLTQVIIDIFPRNPFRAMTEGNMLQVIVFAILFGIALSLAGAAGKRLLAIFEDFNVAIMRLVWIIMEIAPYGVFALIARTFASQGFGAILPLLQYFLVVLAVLVLHALVTYPVLLKVFSGLNPIVFLRKMREAQIFAFSTASSNATIPVTLRTAEQKLGVKRSVASFTVPLGATINMDGTAIMQGVATVFIAQVYQISLAPHQYLIVILTATLASIGTAGVPGVGLIMLAMVLNQVGLPVEGIALILGVDRLLDMVRTAVNITGDATVSCIVGKSEGDFDEAVFYSTEDANGNTSEPQRTP